MKKDIDHNDLNYQLGFVVGLRIIDRNLYSLNIDMLKPNHTNIIKVSKEEEEKYNSLHHDFKARVEYYQTLKDKYLPQTIKVVTDRVMPTDLEMFRSGIDYALWDCDCSNYKVEDLDKFFDPLSDDAWCCEIYLKIDK